MKSERFEKWWRGFEWFILNTQKVWSSSKFKKLKSLCNRLSFRMKPWYFERDCLFCTRSASSFSKNTLNFLSHSMWVKWWHHAKFQPFHNSFVELFIFMGHIAKKSVNAWKITNEVRQVRKMMTWLWMVHFEHTKSLEFK